MNSDENVEFLESEVIILRSNVEVCLVCKSGKVKSEMRDKGFLIIHTRNGIKKGFLEEKRCNNKVWYIYKIDSFI